MARIIDLVGNGGINMFDCNDCGVNTSKINEYYMVYKPIWKEALKEEKDDGDFMLCIGCLEKRLNRKLNAWDFPPELSINKTCLVKGSHRIIDRMLRE